MNSREDLSDDLPDVIVSLNISEMNSTRNGTQAKAMMKTPNDDRSINNIIVGIGAVVVILIVLLIIIKLIHKCYQMYKEDDDDEDQTKDQAKKSPLLPSSTSNIVGRRSSIRNPSAPIRRSSLDIETLMELRQKRLSQQYDHTPPIAKKT